MQVMFSRTLLAIGFGGVGVLVGCATQRVDGGKGSLPVGHAIVPLKGVDQRGEIVELVPPLNGFTVVYFYPKDATPGCTKEACAFRDVWQRYKQAKIDVIGVSSDDVDSHRDFAKEQSIPFPLVADTDGKWASVFGVSSIAGFYSRETFVLAPDGKVAKVYEDVDPGIHAKQILKDVEKLRR